MPRFGQGVGCTKMLKTAAIGAVALGAATLSSCGTKSNENNAKILELQQDSIVLSNQIKSLEKDLTKNDYTKFGLDSTVATSKEDLKRIKEIEIQKRKVKLDEIKSEREDVEHSGQNTKQNVMQILATLITISVAVVVGWKLGDFLYDN